MGMGRLGIGLLVTRTAIQGRQEPCRLYESEVRKGCFNSRLIRGEVCGFRPSLFSLLGQMAKNQGHGGAHLPTAPLTN